MVGTDAGILTRCRIMIQRRVSPIMGFWQHIISAWSRLVAEKGFLIVKGLSSIWFFQLAA